MQVLINGKNFSPLIVEISRKAQIIYSSNTGETLANTMNLDPKGTKIGYTITIDSAYKDQQLLEDFWNEIIKPRREGFRFVAPYNQTIIDFLAYAEGAEQSLISATGINLWGKISVNILPMNPQIESVI